MGYEELSVEHIDKRVEYLANKIVELWKELEPKMKEFDACKQEFEDLATERRLRIDEQNKTRG